VTSPARTLVVPAPAKVNLFLHVTGRRPDGYHLLESLFALVDLADTVTLAPRDDAQVVRPREVDGVPQDEDLAVRAARALQQATGTRRGVTLDLAKRIPMGAGLGGGSSDAASVLVALNRLWQLGLSRAELSRIGLTLGADVPFFVHGEHAIVRGIGEVVKSVSLPPQWLALAMPPVHVPTRAVFADPELTRSTPSAKIDVFSEGYGRNDLQAVVTRGYPPVAQAVRALEAVSRGARMTGSGACAIAWCDSEEQARDAVAALPAGTGGRVVRTLSRHPLAGW
jgi:4-diphosphocytidyl-2-C-methyl-D-erythritol kinase